ncbi:MAG: exodeoxyribonuclease VII small subunit [Verrucomicrobia bacterium]|nr:exodeoxyribonuclease VII small subunit [Verrucomicrobiota bacterium]MCH8525759.1 exodeoxyribonuclease VII small subunit [Kiritimatiellia bacterium]
MPAKKEDTSPETPPQPPPAFEEALKRLETLVAEMEAGSLSLDQMIAHFEEGSNLVDICGKRLNEVERRIEKLVKKDGEITTEPFQTDES